MILNLQSVASVLGAHWAGPAATAAGWSVDTRTQNAGDVYFALHGPNHDGHDFAVAALEKGAAAVVVERGSGDPREIVVPNTLCALQQTGAWARGQWGGKVIGVTGSAGKTTTKDAIAHVLGAELRTGKTIGNLNNHVGVPLSILRMPDDCSAAVLEMGMNHAGEIRELAAIARPDIGVVTNVGYAHTEFFESIEGVAAAKRELIEGLPRDGVAVLNADDPRVAHFADTYTGDRLTFGFSEGADVRAEDAELRADGMGRGRGDGVVDVALTVDDVLPGRRVGVLEVRHEDLCAGVQRVDHHLAVDRAGDLRPAVGQVGGRRRDGEVLRCAHERRRLALAFLPLRKQTLALGVELSVEALDEGERLHRQNV